jgi:hypothetical protein
MGLFSLKRMNKLPFSLRQFAQLDDTVDENGCGGIKFVSMRVRLDPPPPLSRSAMRNLWQIQRERYRNLRYVGSNTWIQRRQLDNIRREMRMLAAARYFATAP